VVINSTRIYSIRYLLIGSRQDTIEKAVTSIVSIRFSMVSSFDTDSSDTSEATGFIVDAEKGIMLTNRLVIVCHNYVFN
jgi:hypothetical protein